MRPAWPLRLWLAAALAVGGGYWALTYESHWWVGYEGPDGFVPKFKLAWYEQAAEVGIVGLAAGVPVIAAAGLTRWIVGRVRRSRG